MRLRFLTLLSVAILLVGCNLYDPNLVDQGRAYVPPRPADSTSSSGDAIEVAFAIRNIFLRNPTDFLSGVGLDLDDRVTRSEQQSECIPPGSGAQIPLDEVDGIDNSLGKNLLPLVGAALPCLEDDLALFQGLGLGTVILDVTGWNGLSDDAQVDVAIANAVDGSSEDPSILTFDNDIGVNLVRMVNGVAADGPAWAGADFWWLDPADFISGNRTQPRNNSNGYVAAGRLVVPLASGSTISLIAGDGDATPGVGFVDVTVSDGWIFGDISDDGKSLVRGAIAGRFGLAGLLDAVPDIGICGSLAFNISAGVQQFADVVLVPQTGGANVLCNAMSLGVGFDAVAGTVAGLAPSSRSKVSACLNPSVANTCCVSTMMAGTAPMGCDTGVYSTQPNPLPTTQPDF